MSSIEFPEGRIDFVGQDMVVNILRFALTVATFVSFVAGFAMQSLQVTFIIFGASTLGIALLLLPPWPMFNRHPVKWEGKKVLKM
ncbi:microsomal signal peptidase 12kDa subunit [Mycena floridula]|nr:microsomal signal peptidase 12kDa subunit [Mycena floridula]